MRVIDKKAELGNNTIFRLLKITVLGKILPLGNFHSGPGLRCILTLAILHRAGYPIYFLLAKYGDKSRILRKVYQKLR